MMLLSSDSDSDNASIPFAAIKTVRKMNMMFLQLHNSIAAAHCFSLTLSLSPHFYIFTTIRLYRIFL